MNWKELKYQQKNRLLGIIAIIFGFVAYFLSIDESIQEYQQFQVLEQKIQQASKAPENIQKLKQNLEHISDNLGNYELNSLHNEDFLLAVISKFCQQNHLILRHFPEPSLHQEKDFMIYTHAIEIQGNYNNLLKLVYEMEQVQKIGRVTSVSYERIKDQKTKTTILIATIYLQHIQFNHE